VLCAGREIRGGPRRRKRGKPRGVRKTVHKTRPLLQMVSGELKNAAEKKIKGSPLGGGTKRAVM